MARPSILPAWATNAVNETKQIDNKTVVLPNKRVIPTTYELNGALFGTTLIRQYFNTILDLLSLWTIHLDARVAVGHVHLDYINVSVATLATRFGGTWQAEGTQALGTIATVYVYRKLT